MDLYEYQMAARRTSRFYKYTKPPMENIIMAALGLSGEVGELNDHIKKLIYHDHPYNPDKVKDELGDILWYIAEMCTALECNLEEIAQLNLAKLHTRYPIEFSSDASINRRD